jgi:hypothetical protein
MGTPTLAGVRRLLHVISPHDLGWHLRTSVDRAILQLMPSIAWEGMMLTGRPPSSPRRGRTEHAPGVPA